MNSVFKKILQTKPPFAEHGHQELRRCLSAIDLILLGVGAIVGAGIFVLTGVAAATKAGPAIVLSYILSGFACAFAAFCYAELATSIGGAGSAYSYAYSGLGEIFAWVIGWDLILEYAISVCAVAVGWSGYMNNFLQALKVPLPEMLTLCPAEGGTCNILASSIIIILSFIVALGVKESARFNAVIVTIKLVVIAIFIYIALHHVNFDYWKPFMPFGWGGVLQGAAIVFFAYIGFDAVSTTAEEVIKPQRDLSIGIIGSLFICTVLYIIVSGLLTLIAPYTSLNVKSPVAEAILNLGHRTGAGIIAIGAIAGLTSVILIFIFGLSRIFFSIARDGLLPPFFSKINKTTQTPLRIIFITGSIMAVIAGLVPLKDIAELVNIGTLAAFIIVCFGVIFLRSKKPDLPRPFKTPYSPLFPILGILFCGLLMLNLPWITWLRFVVWMIVGFFIYFLYGIKHSKLSINQGSQK